MRVGNKKAWQSSEKYVEDILRRWMINVDDDRDDDDHDHQADDQNNGLTVCPGAPSLPGPGPPALSRVNPIIHPTTIIVSIAVIIIITTPPISTTKS